MRKAAHDDNGRKKAALCFASGEEKREERETAARAAGDGRGKGRAETRDRGHIQTLIRDSIIELSQGGRLCLHFQLFAGKRSANTVPGTLNNVGSPSASRTALSALHSAHRFSRYRPPLAFSFSLSHCSSHLRTDSLAWLTPAS